MSTWALCASALLLLGVVAIWNFANLYWQSKHAPIGREIPFVGFVRDEDGE